MPTRQHPGQRWAIIAGAVVLLGLVAACSAGTHSSATGTQHATSSTTAASSVVSSSSLSTSTSRPVDRDATAAACIARLPLRQRVGQMLMVAVDADTLGAARPLFARLGIGGALLMAPGAGIAPESVIAFRDAGSIPMMIAVDEEGGTVQRLAAKYGAIPSAEAVADTMTPAQAEAMIAAHARKVAELGVTVVFAPVVDVRPVGRQGVIGTRSPSDDPSVVTAFGRAYVKGWQSAGILPVLKHFPGHGSATGDTHTGAAVVPPLADLERRDLLPYRALAHGPAVGVMVAHVAVPGFSGGPSSLSPAVYALLRGEFGFRGVAFTDALNMQAIAGQHSVTQAAVTALSAGADVALLPEPRDAETVLDAVVSAVGRELPEHRVDASVLRILTAKRIDPCRLSS